MAKLVLFWKGTLMRLATGFCVALTRSAVSSAAAAGVAPASAATRVAEAQLDIARIRRARSAFISPVVLDVVKLVSLNRADKKPARQIGDESEAAQKLVAASSYFAPAKSAVPKPASILADLG